MEYTSTFKAQVLDAVRKWDNIAKVSREYEVTRQTIYKWIDHEEEIKGSVGKEIEYARKGDELIRKMEQVLPDNIEEADRYLEVLRRYGTARERKQKMNARVEALLWTVLRALEKHPQLEDVHPKDLSKIMGDLETVREKLAGEPTVIVEERNRMKEIVFVAVRDLFGSEAVPKLAERIENMQEAEIEIE